MPTAIGPVTCPKLLPVIGEAHRNTALAMEADLAHRLDEPLGPAARAFADALTRIAARTQTPKIRGA